MIISLSHFYLVKKKRQKQYKKSQTHHGIIYYSSYKGRDYTKGQVILHSVIFFLNFYVNDKFLLTKRQHFS